MTSLTLVRRIAARPSIVFDALTTADGIARWWGPDSGPVLIAETDVRVGGRFRVRFRMLDGTEHESTGEYLVVSKPERLVMSWRWIAPDEPHWRDEESQIEISLRSIEMGTELTFTHSRLPTLSQLFDGRSQLIVYHFMFGPEWDEGCVGCSLLSDHVDGARQHFEHKDISWVAVSRGPIEKLIDYRQRMGWKFRWVSSAHTDFNFDFQVSFPEESRRGGVVYNFATKKKGGNLSDWAKRHDRYEDSRQTGMSAGKHACCAADS